ncbi:hypothetical protein [Oscillibacter sp. 1-3]|uniref:hypothetical protein n=1 Tax=Oscillibacter sp. 1-3 TaxID=1235797 RepID=UPI0003A8E1A9|nr:hypothetical protein [Oscillibacter sp. 1-3]
MPQERGREAEVYCFQNQRGRGIRLTGSLEQGRCWFEIAVHRVQIAGRADEVSVLKG